MLTKHFLSTHSQGGRIYDTLANDLALIELNLSVTKRHHLRLTDFNSSS